MTVIPCGRSVQRLGGQQRSARGCWRIAP